MKNVKNSNRSLNELLSEKMTILKGEGRASHRNYRTLLRYIESRYGVVPMSNVTPQFAAGLHSRLKGDRKSAATIKTYFAMLQSVASYGAYLGCVKGDHKLTRSKSYELDKVKLEKPKTRRNKWLSFEDMSKLWGYWESLPSVNRGEKRYLGLFLASYLANGCNFADLLRLKYDDEYFSSGKRLFGFFRHKTINSSGVYVKVPIISKLKAVIGVVGDAEEYDGLVFGSFTSEVPEDDSESLDLRIMYMNTYCSKVVRKVCVKLGIREDVSVTFARHSYISRMHHIGAPYSLCERNVGHVLAGVADSYIGDYDIGTLFKWNEQIL